MRIRSFRVPFSQILDDESHELEFGPDDYLVVRPVFALSAEALQAIQERMAAIGEAAASDDPDKVKQAERLSDKLYEDVVKATVLEWRLADENGVSIDKPATRAALRKLPGPLAGGLYNFLITYRGDDGPNPTTRS